MSFNTVILYDIENLIGGYGYGNAEMLSNLSLKQIYDDILKKNLGRVAIQRAYANWSDPRLSILKGDIVELGIDPVQMFGFGKGSLKNASDIQLVIDAIEIVFTKPMIDVFVIVSGDGGFSSLAKKLHEYGKTVIGCAYLQTTNKVFEAVSDDFIWLNKPSSEEGSLSKTDNPSYLKDPIISGYVGNISPSKDAESEEIINAAKEVIAYLSTHKEAKKTMTLSGLNISVFSQMLDYRLGGLNYYKLGFSKLTDFIRYITQNTEVKLILKEPSDYRMVFVKTKVKGYQDLDSLSRMASPHRVENYKQILLKGAPVFRQFNKTILYAVGEYMCLNKMDFQDVYIGDILEKLNDEFDLEMVDLKTSIINFINSGCFTSQMSSNNSDEQKYSFIPVNTAVAMEWIKEEMGNKISSFIGEVKAETLESVLM